MIGGVAGKQKRIIIFVSFGLEKNKQLLILKTLTDSRTEEITELVDGTMHR